MTSTNVTQFMVTALLFLAGVSAVFFLIGTSASNADLSNFVEAEQFNESLAVAGSIEGKVNLDTQGGALEVVKTFLSLTADLVNGLLQATLGVVAQTFTALTGLKTTITVIGSNLHLPWWFTSFLIGILGVTLSFAVVAVWRRWHP